MAKKKSAKKSAPKQAGKVTKTTRVKALREALIPCCNEWTITIPKGMEVSQPVTSETGDRTMKLTLAEGVTGKIQLDPPKLLSHKANFRLGKKPKR
jgi:hypothetical protein